MEMVCEIAKDRQAATVEATRVPIPLRPEELAAHYDLTMSQPDTGAVTYAAFNRWLAREAAALGLSFALLHDGTVREVIRRLSTREMTVGYHLDYHATWHRPGDAYAALAEAVQDAGGRPVNAPARSRAFTDKAAAHAELVRHGLGTPATVISRQGLRIGLFLMVNAGRYNSTNPTPGST